MKRLLVPMITIALAGVLVGQVATDEETVRPRQQRAVEALKTALGLDDGQIQQLQDVRQSTAEANRAIAEQIRSQREALRALREAGNPEPTQVGTIVNEVDRLQQEVRANQEQGHEQAVNLINGWGLGGQLEQLQMAAQMIPALGPARRLGLLDPGVGQRNRVRNANRLGTRPRARMGARGVGAGLFGPPPPEI